MKRLASPKLWLGVASLGAVATLAIVDMGKTSPGPLARVHEAEEDLAGRGGCADCHGGWGETMTQSCLACHDDVAAHIRERRGLHGRIAPEKSERCATCHSDHHGAEFAMVNRASFAQMGVPDPETFDHRLVGYEMGGKHLELACDECHPNARVPVPPAGEKRFLGLVRDCASCHEDPHEGRMALDCASCHEESSFAAIRFDRHAEILPLVGGHDAMACRTCHATDDAHALEVVSRGVAQGLAPERRACADCHASPHRSEFVAGVADVVALAADGSCVACHEAEHETFRDDAIAVTPTQHAASGFGIAGAPHGDVGCEKCHAAELRDFATRYPGRAADDCRTCHADPHGRQFDGNPKGRRDCVDCHERERFEPHAFDAAKHATTALPLDGTHLTTDCGECHEGPSGVPEDPRRFHGTASRCEACHADAHGGFFGGLAAAEPDAIDRGACAPCHLTTKFSELPPHGFDHEKFARFPLAGAHAEAACEACHRPKGERDEAGRSFGLVKDAFGVVTGCESCHSDPHGGAFGAKRKGLPADVGGRSGCARCHGTTSFRATEGTFDHGLWTGFALDGAHGKAACSACHAPLARETKEGRTLARAKGARCADCHADPHAGQFVEDGAIDCARCHESATSFAELSFNHNFESRFPLGDIHGGVACDECHKPFDHRGKPVMRYRPLPMRCVDCHGDNSQPLKKRQGAKR